jgi:hypothetical protein
VAGLTRIGMSVSRFGGIQIPPDVAKTGGSGSVQPYLAKLTLSKYLADCTTFSSPTVRTFDRGRMMAITEKVSWSDTKPRPDFAHWPTSVMAEKDFMILLSEALSRIPEDDKQVIDRHLENIRNFLDYYPSEGYCSRGNRGCVVLINLAKRERTIDAIGHEFAHVFFNHPVRYPDLQPGRSEEECEQFERNEHEAIMKASEWGFCPFQDQRSCKELFRSKNPDQYDQARQALRELGYTDNQLNDIPCPE